MKLLDLNYVSVLDAVQTFSPSNELFNLFVPIINKAGNNIIKEINSIIPKISLLLTMVNQSLFQKIEEIKSLTNLECLSQEQFLLRIKDKINSRRSKIDLFMITFAFQKIYYLLCSFGIQIKVESYDFEQLFTKLYELSEFEMSAGETSQ